MGTGPVPWLAGAPQRGCGRALPLMPKAAHLRASNLRQHIPAPPTPTPTPPAALRPYAASPLCPTSNPLAPPVARRSTTTCSRPTRRAAPSTCRARCTVQRSGWSRSSRSKGCRLTTAAAAAAAAAGSSSRQADSDGGMHRLMRAAGSAVTNVPSPLDSFLCRTPCSILFCCARLVFAASSALASPCCPSLLCLRAPPDSSFSFPCQLMLCFWSPLDLYPNNATSWMLPTALAKQSSDAEFRPLLSRHSGRMGYGWLRRRR